VLTGGHANQGRSRKVGVEVEKLRLGRSEEISFDRMEKPRPTT